jgi:hypothetical protein
MDEWLPDGIPGWRRPRRAALLDRWLAAFGPATEMDIRWWTGWAATYARAALAAIGAVEIALEEGSGWVRPATRTRCVAGAVGGAAARWTRRRWAGKGGAGTCPHGPRLFDRSGNVRRCG